VASARSSYWLLPPASTPSLNLVPLRPVQGQSIRECALARQAPAFKVVHELEKQLPAFLYAYEWDLLEREEGKIYKPVTHIEQWIPFVFIVLYIGLVAYTLLG
jgi:hypothetical protein